MNPKEKEENERLGYDPLEAEHEFLEMIKPYKNYVIEKNNEKNIYAIDFKIRGKDAKVITCFDLETRKDSLKSYIKREATIHVLLNSRMAYIKKGINVPCNKIEDYRKHPDKAFHLAWCRGAPRSIEFPEMYLIRGKDIIASPVKDIVDREGYPIKLFDVPMLKVIPVDDNTFLKTITDIVDKKLTLKKVWGI